MRENETVETHGWFDPEVDMFKVKLTVRNENPATGRRSKRGLIFQVSEEFLRYIAEGQHYVNVGVNTPGVNLVEVTNETHPNEDDYILED